MKTQKLASLCILLILALSITAGTVNAEGARYSYMYGVLTGFEFRNFYDNNSDADSTWAVVGNCWVDQYPYYAYPVGLRLWKVNGFWWDDDMGSRYLYNWDYNYWGDLSSGTYHFTLIYYPNGSFYNSLNCHNVNYGW